MYDTSGNIVSEYVQGASGPAPVVRYVRDSAGKAISMIQGNSTYYFIYNGHGDVTALTDSSGAVVATYSYGEFGNQTSSAGTIYNPLRYSGANNAYFDTETSLYKMGARYYQPDVARWLTRDAYKGDKENLQTRNMYIYVENNPLGKADPTGFWGDDIHYKMTYERAYSYFGDSDARTIAQGSKDMDNWQNWAGANFPNNLKYHFDGLKSAPNSIKIRFKKTSKTALYYIRKGNRSKGLWWFGMGLHSIQDSYAHPKGEMGVVMHAAESGIGMFGRSKLGWFSPAAKWYGAYGSVYDDPANNKKGYVKALQATNDLLAKLRGKI